MRISFTKCRSLTGAVLVWFVFGTTGCEESRSTSSRSWESTSSRSVSADATPAASEPIGGIPEAFAPDDGGVPESARSGIGSTGPTSDFEAARDHRLTAVQKRLAEISDHRGSIGRGIGGVLTFGHIPWKVVVTGEDVTLYDEHGYPLRVARPSVPYFVFRQHGNKLLIGRLQDAELVQRNGGWVEASHCFSWYSRRLVYPRPDSLATRALAEGLGPEYALPEYDVDSTMPWPILAETESADWLILCDLRYYGSGFWPLPIQAGHVDEFQVFVLFSETELDKTIENITALGAIVESGKIAVTELPRALGSFLTQNQVDFLDLREARRTVELFPGGAPDFLMKRELDARIKRVMQGLLTQLRYLLRIVRTHGFYNEAHSIYVVPLEALNRIKLEAAA